MNIHRIPMELTFRRQTCGNALPFRSVRDPEREGLGKPRIFGIILAQRRAQRRSRA